MFSLCLALEGCWIRENSSFLSISIAEHEESKLVWITSWWDPDLHFHFSYKHALCFHPTNTAADILNSIGSSSEKKNLRDLFPVLWCSYRKKIVCSTLCQSIRSTVFFCKEHSIRHIRLCTEIHHCFSSALISFRITSWRCSVVESFCTLFFCTMLILFFFTSSGFYRSVVCSNQSLPYFLMSFSYSSVMLCTLLPPSSPLQFSPLSCKNY